MGSKLSKDIETDEDEESFDEDIDDLSLDE